MFYREAIKLRRIGKLLTASFLSWMLLSATVASSNVPNVRNTDVVEAFVDGVVKSAMKEHQSYAGVVTWMIDDETVFSKGYGHVDLEKRKPVDPEASLFRPGSISKLFTWVAVMQMVEQGSLDLDTDINNYLESFHIPDSWPGEPVTLRHIMTHTAGFESGGFGYLVEREVEEIQPLAEFLENHQPERVHAPGTMVIYSNWATALAGLIVQEVAGVPFNDYVQKNIFDVLRMRSSSFYEPLPQKLGVNMTKVYDYKNGEFVEQNYEIISNFGPAGASAVTASDMTLFARAILGDGSYQGRRILKPETLTQMLTEGFTHDNRVRGMGLGFIERRLGSDDLEVFGHDGGTSFFTSHLGLSKTSNFMLFSSFAGPGSAMVHQALVSSFYDEFFPKDPTEWESPADFAERAPNYAGTYFPSRTNYTKWESVLKPISASTVTDNRDGSLLLGGKRYVEVAKNIFREQYGNGRIAFLEDDERGVRGYVVDGMQVMEYYRVPFFVTLPFMGVMLGLSLLVFLAIILKTFFQWSAYRKSGHEKRNLWSSSLAIAISNIAFILLVVFSFAGTTISELMYELPELFKISLLFPILALLSMIFHAYQILKMWRSDSELRPWTKAKLTIVLLLGTYMVWFYYTWNLLGWNYFS